MTPDMLSPLSTVTGWLAARLVLSYAKSHDWTTEQKRVVPLVALVVGAIVQSGGASLLGGGSIRDVFVGAAYGALAVAAHEITRTPPRSDPGGE